MNKAQAATGLVMAFGGITILLIAIFFISEMQGNIAERNTEKIEHKVDDQITLLNYLRTPVDSQYTIADLIVNYKMNKDETVKADIENVSKQILNPVFDDPLSWRINLDGKELAKERRCGKIRSVSQEIFLFDGNKAKVELIICD